MASAAKQDERLNHERTKLQRRLSRVQLRQWPLQQSNRSLRLRPVLLPTQHRLSLRPRLKLKQLLRLSTMLSQRLKLSLKLRLRLRVSTTVKPLMTANTTRLS